MMAFVRSGIMVPDICTINDFQPLLGTLEAFTTLAHIYIIFYFIYSIWIWRTWLASINILYHTDCMVQRIISHYIRNEGYECVQRCGFVCVCGTLLSHNVISLQKCSYDSKRICQLQNYSNNYRENSKLEAHIPRVFHFQFSCLCIVYTQVSKNKTREYLNQYLSN